MPRPSMSIALVLAGLLPSCHEAATLTPGPEPAPVVTPTPDPVAPEPAAPAPTIVRIVGDQIHVGDAVAATARPATAPGELDDELRPTYAIATLREALAPTKDPAQPDDEPAEPNAEPAEPDDVIVVVEPSAPISHLRAVLASAERPLRIRTEPNPATAEPLADSLAEPSLHPVPDGAPPRVVVRPRGELVRLWVDDRPESAPTPVAELGAALAALDPALLTQGVAIDLPDERDAASLMAVVKALAGASTTTTLMLALDLAPCLPPSEDMSCVPGGPVIVGHDDGPPEERPERELLISTFYIDRHEVTIAQFDACRADRACRRRINGQQGIMQPFVGPDQPAMPMDYKRATAYCAWVGKRLPTEWEWEKAARGPNGDTYSWGNDEPTCDKAIYRECAPWGCTPYPGKEFRYDCNEHATKPVGSFAPGHYDLYDMAGNGYEWTMSAGVEDLTTCGDACEGRDPLGPCDGAAPCNKTRVLRGGSWYWPHAQIRGSHRRVEHERTGGHRLSMRCATELPFLTHFPPRVLEEARPALALPEPPTERELEIFARVTDDAVEDKKICPSKVREGWHPSQIDGGRSEPTCRDPFSYLQTNEPRGFVFEGYIRNLGGAYVGIGSDQNYNYIAAARSRWAWVMDYDPRVVHNHLRLRALILASPTADDFVAMFSDDRQHEALAILDEALADHPQHKAIRWGYMATRTELHAYFQAQRAPSRVREDFGWLRNDEHYEYIRTLYQQGRLVPKAGDLLVDGAMQAMGAAARELGVPVRIYYTSNAPTAWGGQVTDAYRRNVLSLPFDHLSLVLQTTDGGGSMRQKTKWHHNVQWGRLMHERLHRPGYDNVWKLLEGRIPGNDDALTVLGLPSAP